MESKHRSFFILVAALIVFSVGAAFFADRDDMVYEPTEDTEETEPKKSVSAPAAESYEDFFTGFRLQRGTQRDRDEELYQSVLQDDAAGDEAKAEARAALSLLYHRIALEDQTEEILVGRNYDDALLVLGDTISLLIIKKQELSEEEKNSLSAFVSAYAGIDGANLSIFTVE